MVRTLKSDLTKGIFSLPPEPKNHFTYGHSKLINWIIKNWWFFAIFYFLCCQLVYTTVRIWFNRKFSYWSKRDSEQCSSWWSDITWNKSNFSLVFRCLLDYCPTSNSSFVQDWNLSNICIICETHQITFTIYALERQHFSTQFNWVLLQLGHFKTRLYLYGGIFTRFVFSLFLWQFLIFKWS